MIGQRVRRPRDRAVGTITATVMPEPGWRRLCVLWDGPPGHVFEQFCDVDTIERWHGEPPPIELPPEHLPNTELVEADLTAQLGLDLGW